MEFIEEFEDNEELDFDREQIILVDSSNPDELDIAVDTTNPWKLLGHMKALRLSIAQQKKIVAKKFPEFTVEQRPGKMAWKPPAWGRKPRISIPAVKVNRRKKKIIVPVIRSKKNIRNIQKKFEQTAAKKKTSSFVVIILGVVIIIIVSFVSWWFFKRNPKRKW